MKPIIVKPLDIKRFNVFAAHTRSPAAAYNSKELAWFSNEEETVLGVLLLDTIDNDYVGILLGRDEVAKFRCFDIKVSIETETEARNWIENTIKWHSRNGAKIFPQGDTNNKKPLNLFTPIKSIEKLHPSFMNIIKLDGFLPARQIISEIMSHYIDIDGNFVEQFQTTGFDARLWELYLNSYITEEQLFTNRDYDRPDFLVKKYGKSVAIEAVIVGRQKDNPISVMKIEDKLPNSEKEIKERLEHEIPIRFGSPLFSKLKKEYWKLDHIRGLPLVFAIADFHDDQSMLWTSTALHNYLYGVRHEYYHDENGQLIIEPTRIETHEFNGKKIPSGFFFQPNAENVSAILFSASGTISKFNRLGRQAGFIAPNVLMHRIGTCYDHNPNASLPKVFKYLVDESCNETWSEGLSMFHNPNAKIPVPKELFPSIAHHHFDNNQIISNIPDFYPYASNTFIMHLTK